MKMSDGYHSRVWGYDCIEIIVEHGYIIEAIIQVADWPSFVSIHWASDFGSFRL